MTNNTEQQAVPVAQESAARKLLIDFMTSPSYDPHAKRHGDTVEAAIAFTIRVLSLPCKSGEGAEAIYRARRSVNEGYHNDKADLTNGDLRQVLHQLDTALTPDATQTREAELVAALKGFVDDLTEFGRNTHGCLSFSHDRLTARIKTARAALNARGGA